MIKQLLEKCTNFFSKSKKEDEDEDESNIILLALSDFLTKIETELFEKNNKNPSKSAICELYLEKIHAFSCKKNISLENFINLKDPNNNAVSWELKKKSRTYLLIHEKHSKKYEKLSIAGFFTIGLTTIDIDIEKGINGYSKTKLKELFNESKISYLIGKIAKNDKYKIHIQGKDIIKFATEIIHETHKKIGRDLVLIEAYYDKIVDIYIKLDFKILQIIEEKNGKKRTQLIKKI